jgi:multisubunit Na+/H+ antiporter MnhB subunit
MSGASLFRAGGSSADLDMTQIISGASAVLLRNF